MLKAKRQVATREQVWRRWAFGSGAILLIALGLSVRWLPLATTSQDYVEGTLLKAGAVFAITWLALPQLEYFGWHRLRGTLLIGIVVVLILWIIRPRIGAIAAAILISVSTVLSVSRWLRQMSEPRR